MNYTNAKILLLDEELSIMKELEISEAEEIIKEKEINYVMKLDEKAFAQPFKPHKLFFYQKRYFCRSINVYNSNKIKEFIVSTDKYYKESKNIFYSGIDNELYVYAKLEISELLDEWIPIFCVFSDVKKNILLSFYDVGKFCKKTPEIFVRFSMDSFRFSGDYFIDFYVSGNKLISKKIVYKEISNYGNMKPKSLRIIK